MDSLLEQRGFELAVPPRPARGAAISELHPGNAHETNGVEHVQPCWLFFQMGPRVRILLPPAESRVRTRLLRTDSDQPVSNRIPADEDDRDRRGRIFRRQCLV